MLPWDITTVKQFICVLIGIINMNFFEGLPTDRQTNFLTTLSEFLRDHSDVIQERYNYFFPNQNKAPGPSGPSDLLNHNLLNAILSNSDFSAGPSTSNFNVPDLNTLPDPSATGLGGSAALYAAGSSTAAHYAPGSSTAALYAAGSSTAALYTPVASIPVLNTNRKRKYTNEKKFECTYEGCNKKFSRVNHLNDHINIHGNKRPHKCPDCSHRFNSFSNLQAHINTHGNKRPHKCPDCSRGFNSPSNLQVHINTHGDKRPHKCPHCNRGFNSISNLNDHIDTHGDKRPHKCPHCSRGFNSPSTLYRHKKSKHKDDQKQEK